ncbi:hypothetical protein PR003_g6545 [Phytophthora rubi]|uniref:Uncharacterized protein n=1 Tax=Phytophthora rubi TaxID=129364 RepID=A0A6A4FPJ4_9STRA|nr:hypothetical protein PR003_g6545 [Phytophthora rubi]
MLAAVLAVSSLPSSSPPHRSSPSSLSPPCAAFRAPSARHSPRRAPIQITSAY